jgi:hypothetical protein
VTSETESEAAFRERMIAEGIDYDLVNRQLDVALKLIFAALPRELPAEMYLKVLRYVGAMLLGEIKAREALEASREAKS